MLYTVTTSPLATFENDRIICNVQDDVQISMTVHEAVRLMYSLKSEALKAITNAAIEAPACEVIAFPAAKVRKAIVAARKAAKA